MILLDLVPVTCPKCLTVCTTAKVKVDGRFYTPVPSHDCTPVTAEGAAA